PSPSRTDGDSEPPPTTAPGIEQPWKPGTPDLSQRLLPFPQTIRHRAIVIITTAEDGGYFIDLKVYKELQDLPRPSRATAGDATVRLEQTVQRQFEGVEPEPFESAGVSLGRACELEPRLLDRPARLDCIQPR